MRRIAIFALFALAFAGAFAVAPPRARASAPIFQTLAQLRGMSDSSFSKVVQWARTGAPPVYASTYDYEQAEGAIGNLPSAQRHAILQWLRGNGRGGLYTLGITDNDIGRRRAGADSAPATQNQYRPLQFVSETVGQAQADGSNIAFINGFGAAKHDGKILVICVSFQNNAAKAATLVHFLFTVSDGNGKAMFRLPLDRKGTFSSGVAIHTFPSFSDWVNGANNRGYSENCTKMTEAVASLPIMQAKFVTFKVTNVEYDDGTRWSATP